MRTRRRPAPALVPVVESMVLRPGLGAGGGEERGEGLAEARTAADAPAEADDHSRGEQDCTSIFFFVDYFISFFFFFFSPQCARWLCSGEKGYTNAAF
jgi:hypothetical protein